MEGFFRISRQCVSQSGTSSRNTTSNASSPNRGTARQLKPGASTFSRPSPRKQSCVQKTGCVTERSILMAHEFNFTFFAFTSIVKKTLMALDFSQ